MKFKCNDVVTTIDGTRQFIVTQDTTDESTLVHLQTMVQKGQTMVWVTTRAPMNDLIKINKGEQQ